MNIKTLLTLLAATPLVASAIQITSFDLYLGPEGADTVQWGATMEMTFIHAQEPGGFLWDGHFSGTISTHSPITVAEYYHHGPEERGEFIFDNTTGEFISARVYWEDYEGPLYRDISFYPEFLYNPANGSGLIRWSGQPPLPVSDGSAGMVLLIIAGLGLVVSRRSY
jgi:hypothetical protein